MRTPSPDVNQQLIAIGFAYCSSSASGHTSRMSAAISRERVHRAQAAEDAARPERVADASGRCRSGGGSRRRARTRRRRRPGSRRPRSRRRSAPRAGRSSAVTRRAGRAPSTMRRRWPLGARQRAPGRRPSARCARRACSRSDRKSAPSVQRELVAAGTDDRDRRHRGLPGALRDSQPTTHHVQRVPGSRARDGARFVDPERYGRRRAGVKRPPVRPRAVRTQCDHSAPHRAVSRDPRAFRAETFWGQTP